MIRVLSAHSKQATYKSTKKLIIMPIQVSKTIPVDSRMTLIRNRDNINNKYGVMMFFPKDLVRGVNQEMILKGGPNAISRAEREINVILTEWRAEFDAFRQRRALRKQTERAMRVDGVKEFPKVAKREVKKTNGLSKNAFSALLDEEKSSLSDVVEVIGPKPVTKVKSPTLKGWATMAAKAPVPVSSASESESEPKKVEVITNIEKTPQFKYPPLKSFDWADAVDDEDNDEDDVWENWN